MNLPSDLDSKFHGGSKNAVLIFEDEIKAMKWEQKMILWERSEKNEATERSMLRSLKFGHLYEKIHLPEREFDGVVVFNANNSGAQHVAVGIRNAQANFGFKLL
jgi:hypothetical protein